MDTYNSAMGYLGKSLETQTMEEHHQTFLKLFLKGKLREVIQFVYEREKGGVLQPEQLDEDKTGTINETVTSFLEVTQPRKTIPSCATLETYEQTPIFIPIDITEEAVELVTRKLSEISVPGGTDSESLQVWLLKFGENNTKLLTSIEFFYWLANGSPLWAAYRAFMSGWMVALDKQPGVRPVGVGETWRRIFANIVLKVMGTEATMVCQDDQLCAGLKAGIYGAIYAVQALCDENSSTQEWVFLLLDAKKVFNKIN